MKYTTETKLYIKNNKNEKETDICKIKTKKTGVYQITTDFMFKYDNQFFTLKLKHDLDEERNKNTKLFKLYLNDENGDKISNLGDLYVSNGKKDLFIEEVSLNIGSKINTNNILNKINNFFDLKLNVDFGNYYKQISTNKESNEQLIDIDFYDKDLKSKNYIFHKTSNCNSISTNNIRIYKEKKENLVGTEISKIKYRSKYFAEDLFNIIKSDADLSSFISEKTYSDIVKNGTDLSQDKFILSKEKEIEDNQERWWVNMKENNFKILSKKNNSIDFIYNGKEYNLTKTDYNESEYEYYITKDKDKICSLIDYHANDGFHFLNLADKKEFDLDFFNTLIENKLINEKINYNNIHDLNFQKEISKKNNNCKETSMKIILMGENDDYQTSISTFNFNNETYFVTKDGDYQCFLYSIEKYNKDLNLIENVMEFNKTIKEDNSIKYEVFVKNEKNINDGFLEKINKEYFLDLNKGLLTSAKNINILVDDENDKAIFEINNKKYELEKQINEDNGNQHHFTIDTTVKNENSEIIFNFHQDVNSPNWNESKLDFNKNEFTKEIYDSIMLSSELYDLMPDVIKYSLKYEDLEIDKDDLER